MASAQAYFLVKNGVSSQAFQLREIPEPLAAPDEAVIDVEASGLNFADVMARQGHYQDAPPIPCVIGYEVVGRIRSLGKTLAAEGKFRVGSRVVAFTRFGGYASRIAVSGFAIAEIPDSMDAATATALATQGCTAYFAVEEMVRVHAGDRVLVQAAAGGVGSLLIQLLKRRGAVVFGTAGSEAKLKLLKECGVDYPIGYRTQEFDVAVREILKTRGEEGLDVVFDAVGGSHVKRGMGLLRAGGRLVCYGAAQMSGDTKNPVRMLKTAAGFGFIHYIPLMMSSRSVIGINMLKVADQRPEVMGRCLREVVALAVKGELKPWPAKSFPVREIAQAHDLLASRESSGKVALIW